MPIVEDNVVTPQVDNNDTQKPEVRSSWKESLSADLRGSPVLQKFEDTPEGLGKVFESYSNLEKLLGHEKIPVPKDDNDTAAWGMFNKAFGIPDKPEGYGLEDAKIPENIKGMTMDKAEFSQAMLEARVPKSSVNKLWKVYQQKNIDGFNKVLQQQQDNINKNINQLKSEWGQAYDINVQLGQQVINRFTTDAEENDAITAMLTSSPAGIKFLARIGDQFAENKVTEFQMKKFTMSPEGAHEEIQSMTRDLNGPYHNQSGKFTEREHKAAVERVNMLYAVINKSGQA